MSANGDDTPEHRKPVAAAARSKEAIKGLAELAAGLDAFCARMNTGLSAVALVLALAVLVTLSFRAPPTNYFAPDLLAAEDISAAAE